MSDQTVDEQPSAQRRTGRYARIRTTIEVGCDTPDCDEHASQARTIDIDLREDQVGSDTYENAGHKRLAPALAALGEVEKSIKILRRVVVGVDQDEDGAFHAQVERDPETLMTLSGSDLDFSLYTS